MSKKKSGNNRRAPEAEPEVNIAPIVMAAFDGDSDALELLQELADEGNLEALVYAELAQDNLADDDADGNEDEFDVMFDD